MKSHCEYKLNKLSIKNVADMLYLPNNTIAFLVESKDSREIIIHDPIKNNDIRTIQLKTENHVEQFFLQGDKIIYGDEDAIFSLDLRKLDHQKLVEKRDNQQKEKNVFTKLDQQTSIFVDYSSVKLFQLENEEMVEVRHANCPGIDSSSQVRIISPKLFCVYNNFEELLRFFDCELNLVAIRLSGFANPIKQVVVAKDQVFVALRDGSVSALTNISLVVSKTPLEQDIQERKLSIPPLPKINPQEAKDSEISCEVTYKSLSFPTGVMYFSPSRVMQLSHQRLALNLNDRIVIWDEKKSSEIASIPFDKLAGLGFVNYYTDLSKTHWPIYQYDENSILIPASMSTSYIVNFKENTYRPTNYGFVWFCDLNESSFLAKRNPDGYGCFSYSSQICLFNKKNLPTPEMNCSFATTENASFALLKNRIIAAGTLNNGNPIKNLFDVSTQQTKKLPLESDVIVMTLSDNRYFQLDKKTQSAHVVEVKGDSEERIFSRSHVLFDLDPSCSYKICNVPALQQFIVYVNFSDRIFIVNKALQISIHNLPYSVDDIQLKSDKEVWVSLVPAPCSRQWIILELSHAVPATKEETCNALMEVGFFARPLRDIITGYAKVDTFESPKNDVNTPKSP